MRNQTTADYAARIARAVALIENTAEGDAPPPLSALAEAAALSPFHFHRVFRLMTGETLGAVCQRLRLARSLEALADTNLSITQASAGSGYATTQSYGRALQQAVGSNATALRADPVVAARAAASLRKGPTDAPLAITVVSLKPFQVLALRRQGPYAELDAGFDCLFKAVFTQLDPATLRGIWGVPLDDEASIAPQRALFDCALDVGGRQPDEPGLSAMTLGGCIALAMDHLGSYDAIHAMLDRLYGTVVNGQTELANLPPLIHYHDEPDSKPEAELKATLYLPLAG